LSVKGRIENSSRRSELMLAHSELGRRL
jgi:hypothetical protein